MSKTKAMAMVWGFSIGAASAAFADTSAANAVMNQTNPAGNNLPAATTGPANPVTGQMQGPAGTNGGPNANYPDSNAANEINRSAHQAGGDHNSGLNFDLHTAPSVNRNGVNTTVGNTGVVSDGANAPGTSNNALTSPGANATNGAVNGQPIRIEQAAPVQVSPTGR